MMNDASREAAVRTRLGDRLMHAKVARSLLGPHGGLAVTLGRFVVLDRIGSGGMGSVYRAYDPDLDRQVALKVLSPQPLHAQEHEQRLRREATALARLSDPHVVVVYETGRCADELYVVMELVDGVDLREWARAHPVVAGSDGRARFEHALSLLLQAGRGLAAAHHVGLVHRDFKPSNVLVGNDGRARVADFGLARPFEGPPADTSPEREDGATATRGSHTTKTGAVLGTPRYMAPEQRAGRVVDDKADLFAFCVTAWELLFGEHPWPRGEPSEEQEPRAPEGAPARIVQVLREGLRSDPQQRHRTLEEVLDALALPSGSGRSRWMATLGVLALAGTATAGFVSSSTQASSPPCADAAMALDSIWSPTQRETLGAALRGAGQDYAEATARLVVARIDEHARQWSDAAVDACEAGLRSGVATSAAPSATRQCLDDRLIELGALVEVLLGGDEAMVRRAVDAAWSLRPVALCTDPRFVAATSLPADDARAERVEQRRARLATIGAIADVGRFDEAHTMLETELPAIRELGHDPLTVDALRLMGWLESRGRSREAAVELLEEAFEIATRAGYEHGAYLAARKLMFVEGVSSGHTEAARAWERVATSLFARIDDGRPEPMSTLLHARGLVAIEGGAFERAAELLERATELLGPRSSEASQERARIYNARGNLAMRLGDFEGAAELYQQAITASELTYGPEHPATAASILNLGVADYQRSRFPLARAHFERAVEIQRAAFGNEGPEVSASLSALANVLAEQGDPAAALPLAEESVELVRRGGSPSSLAQALSNLSLIFSDLGRLDDASRVAEEALTIRRRHARPESPELVESLMNVASLASSSGDHERALELVAEALALVDSLGEEHPMRGSVLGAATQLRVSAGHLEGAERDFERALSILPSDHPEHGVVAENLDRLRARSKR